MNSGAKFSTISSAAIVIMQKKTQFLFTEEETFWLQWRVEAVAGAVGPAISGSCSTDSTSRRDTANVANVPKNYNV